jgi:hypothetical protein
MTIDNEVRHRLCRFARRFRTRRQPCGSSRAGKYFELQSQQLDRSARGYHRIPIRGKRMPVQNGRLTLESLCGPIVLFRPLSTARRRLAPIAAFLITGIWSGFVLTTGSTSSGSATTTAIAGYKRQASMPSFTITVNNTNPAFFYCAQISHCQSGMVFALNPSV